MKRGMKIIIWLVLINLLFCLNSYALDIQLLNLREKIFAESTNIKDNISAESKDFVLLSGLFDSCILMVNQIDAYFYLLGVFEFIRKEDLNKNCFNFILSWLNTMKKTNSLSLKNLSTAGPIMESQTKTYIENIKNYLLELDKQITREQNRMNILMRSLGIR